MMEKPRNDAVNNEDVEVLEAFVRAYREGKIPGVVISYQTDEGTKRHHLLGEFTSDYSAVNSQMGSLEMAVNRLFLCRPS